jgi:excisionase family DNA binding protein
VNATYILFRTVARMTDDEDMTTEEVAAMFRTSDETVRYWHHIGKGPASYKVGRRRLYPRAGVLAWRAAQRDAASATA